MADFFEDWGKRISEAASDLSKKTEDTIEIQKIKSDIRSLNRGNVRDYTDIGKAVYDKYLSGEVIDGDMAALCEAIEKRNQQVKDLEEDIARIKGEA